MTKSSHHDLTALITGAGSGIGRACAERFLREGFRVVAVGRKIAPLGDVVARAPAGRALAISCDLTKASDVDRLTQQLAHDSQFGATLKVLVNNAGIYERKPLVSADDAHWAAMFETNLMGPVRLTRSLYPLLRANQGVVINVSSTLSLRSIQEAAAYSAAKAAMNSWTETLALESAPDGVRANCVAPGIVDTPIHAFTAEQKTQFAGFQPLGRVGEPADVAHAVWSLAAPGSEWITGSILKVDGGIHLV